MPRRRQQRARLRRHEAQVGLAELGDPALGAQPGQRQRRVGARGHHQVQPRREAAAPAARSRPAGRRRSSRWRSSSTRNDSARRRRRQVVDQRCQPALDRAPPAAAAQLDERLIADRAGQPLQRGDEVRPQPPGIVVLAIDRQPRPRLVQLAQPPGEQRRLPEPGRRAQQRDRRRRRPARCADGGVPAARSPAGHRRQELRRQQRRGGRRPRRFPLTARTYRARTASRPLPGSGPSSGSPERG